MKDVFLYIALFFRVSRLSVNEFICKNWMVRNKIEVKMGWMKPSGNLLHQWSLLSSQLLLFYWLFPIRYAQVSPILKNLQPTLHSTFLSSCSPLSSSSWTSTLKVWSTLSWPYFHICHLFTLCHLRPLILVTSSPFVINFILIFGALVVFFKMLFPPLTTHSWISFYFLTILSSVPYTSFLLCLSCTQLWSLVFNIGPPFIF